ncbi:holo-ACP synthase [Kocuria koreensis]|uniref:Holo-[acyl-carrier-protein] synthase n=1 Tax=Rothia koreensis TaxID=592378 RepID=A0A7K1LF66_9MICC|nr:holo-ACP synthase [Rothia koreensis]MDN5603840.1 holo-ACP synthase [Kocuria sp.]MDN5617485.1 holo-ACP synthase [Kocuria sp.]MUN53825.1 holo-ACP synthase [Rothia koreensis]
MIMGTGVDVVDIDRFAEIIQRTPRLRDRLFTREEHDLPARSLAGRFAVREAVAKALHAPPGMIWRHCWVRKDRYGAPRLVVTGTIRETAEHLGINRWHVSITHDGGVAMASVIAERLNEEELLLAQRLEETTWG